MTTKTLWAPWRGEWIDDQKKRQAKPQPVRKKFDPFIELPKGGASEKTLVLFSNPRIFVVLNRFPYNPGHLMVIPRQKVDRPEKLSAKVWAELNTGLTLCMQKLQKAYDPQGFNVGMNIGAVSGAGIPDHIHWHVVPRWGGDTNFMPLIAEVKAIPSHNVTIYRKLKPLFATFADDLRKAMIE
jgi:ATP adenylyltransferase